MTMCIVEGRSWETDLDEIMIGCSVVNDEIYDSETYLPIGPIDSREHLS
jgi:hypothetical protein